MCRYVHLCDFCNCPLLLPRLSFYFVDLLLCRNFSVWYVSTCVFLLSLAVFLCDIHETISDISVTTSLGVISMNALTVQKSSRKKKRLMFSFGSLMVLDFMFMILINAELIFICSVKKASSLILFYGIHDFPSTIYDRHCVILYYVSLLPFLTNSWLLCIVLFLGIAFCAIGHICQSHTSFYCRFLVHFENRKYTSSCVPFNIILAFKVLCEYMWILEFIFLSVRNVIRVMIVNCCLH